MPLPTKLRQRAARTVRHTLAAAELVDAGCSMHKIAAITGHPSLSMVQLYTRSADQERRASAAIIRLSEHADK